MDGRRAIREHPLSNSILTIHHHYQHQHNRNVPRDHHGSQARILYSPTRVPAESRCFRQVLKYIWLIRPPFCLRRLPCPQPILLLVKDKINNNWINSNRPRIDITHPRPFHNLSVGKDPPTTRLAFQTTMTIDNQSTG